MRPRRRLGLAASGGVLLALLGVWLGHTAEYVRVAGTAGLREELVGSIHWYMVPLGLALAGVAAGAAVWAWRLWTRLDRQLAATRQAIRRAWRGAAGAPAPKLPAATAAPRSGITRAWLLLASAQVGLYLLQENLEAWAAGVPAPGLDALTGRHWAATLIHGAVAFVLLSIVRAGRRLLHHRSGAALASRALLDVLLAVMARGTAPRRATGCRAARRPADRFGRLWGRPPPLLLTTG